MGCTHFSDGLLQSARPLSDGPGEGVPLPAARRAVGDEAALRAPGQHGGQLRHHGQRRQQAQQAYPVVARGGMRHVRQSVRWVSLSGLCSVP